MSLSKEARRRNNAATKDALIKPNEEVFAEACSL
jgi:hypothetical protein